MEQNKFDVIVVGGGPGGYPAAIRLAQKGKNVLIVEKDNLGGICLNEGCIPTKTLLHSSHIIEVLKEASKFGVELNSSSYTLHWEKMLAKKNEVVTKLVGGVGFLMKKNKITTVKGNAHAIDAHTIEVNGVKYNFTDLVIATGSHARMLSLPGFEDGYNKGEVIYSKEALKLPSIPKTLVVIGGGVIGIEFAVLYKRLGSNVTVLQDGEFILPQLDEDCKKELTRILIRDGLKIVTNVKVTKYEQHKVFYTDKDGVEHSIEAEKTLVSIGRIPASEGFDKIGLEIDRGRIVTNSLCQTNIPHIYAIGDVTNRKMLAHFATAQSRIVAHTILGHKDHLEEGKVPSVIYTYPEVSSIGLTEKEARDKNLDIKVSKFPFMALGKAIADSQVDGFVKLIADAKTKKIIGGHIISTHASDMVSELAVMMEAGLDAEVLAKAIHPHPSLSEAVMEAAEGLFDKPVHI